MLFSWLVLIFFTRATCSVVPLNEEEKCTTRDCEYLYENFVRRVELNERSPCENVHAYVCDKEYDFDIDQHVSQQYLYLMDNVSLILTSESFDRGGEAIQSEKKLYKQCLKLGSESDSARNEINETLTFLRDLERRSANNKSWQEIDEEISLADMGRAFFDIRAVQDQDNLEKNIIMITPPTLTSLLNIYQVFNETVENVGLQNHMKSHPIYRSIYECFEIQKAKPMKDFFSSLFDAAAQYLQGIPKDYEDSKNFKVSLRNWTREFNRHRDEEDKTYINFEVIIRDAFRNVGISVQENEFIIVKNHPYFNELFQILSRSDNEIIGLAVVMRALVDNLRYFNWNFAQLINRVDKTSFCLKETRLYGVSYEILSAFKNGRWPFQVYNFEESVKILDNIKNSLKLRIIDANLTYTREAYLRNQLDVITANILKNVSTRDTVFTDYDLFKPSNGYFKNINNYRYMLKLKELSNLKMHPQISTKYPPFSLVHLVEPSNRFTINALFSGSELPKQFVPKQVYYGSYGVRMASMVYALLNENKYHDLSYVNLNRSIMYKYYDYDFDKISPIFINSKGALDANPDYHLDKMQCFLPEIHQKPVVSKTRDLENMVSDAYGLQLAYDAMIKVDWNDYNNNSVVLFPKQNLHDLRQFFYLAYVKSRCKTRAEYVNAVVFNDEYFTDHFRMCAKEYSMCQMTPFEHISNNIFLI